MLNNQKTTATQLQALKFIVYAYVCIYANVYVRSIVSQIVPQFTSYHKAICFPHNSANTRK